MFRSRVQDVGVRQTAAFTDGRFEAQSCAFALARDCDRADSERRYALQPGTEQAVELDVVSIQDALLALGQRLPAGLGVRYIHLKVDRAVEVEDVDPVAKRMEVWALAGQLHTANGRTAPIGWSGSGGGLDQLGNDRHAGRLCWLAEALDGAEPGDAARTPVLLSEQAAAVLLHEAIGHYVEGSADPRVNLAHRLGRRIASEILDLADDPAAPGTATAYDYDDEGIETLGATQVVRQGVVATQLHSRRSAELAGVLSTGNGRAGVWSSALPRMSNLVCAPGGDSEEALIEDLWNGLMIHHLAHGYGRGGEIEARVVLAEHVARGRRTGRFVSGLRVTETIDLFLRARRIGDRALPNPNGMCGKAGQVLFDVGAVAPCVLLDCLELRP